VRYIFSIPDIRGRRSWMYNERNMSNSY